MSYRMKVKRLQEPLISSTVFLTLAPLLFDPHFSIYFSS
jgi:hypothetical protein